MRIKVAETSISPTTDTDTVPQPYIANVFWYNIGTPVEFVTSLKYVSRFSNIIYLQYEKVNMQLFGKWA